MSFYRGFFPDSADQLLKFVIDDKIWLMDY